MLHLTSIVALAASGRRLSQIPIGKYPPTTDVKDHANIDLDQKALEASFGSSPYNFAGTNGAKSKWQGVGGFSKVTATCTLTTALPAALDSDATTGTSIVKYAGVGTGNPALSGTFTADAASGATVVTFKTQVLANGADARVDTSAIISKSDGTTDTSLGTCASVTYQGGRTLQGFSTGAKAKMLDCAAKETGTLYANGCPYTSYKPYYDYYCAGASSACKTNGDYVNQWVVAAADGTATALDNFNMDFSTGPAKEETFRKDFLKKVSKFAGVWMYVMREFEDAIDDCARQDLTANSWSDGSVHAWDEGVAFYVGGSVPASDFYDVTTGEETSPTTSYYLPYTLGNKRCANFKTCGRSGDRNAGEAYVNYELWKAFSDGRDAILSGNCGGAVPVKNLVVQLATVPLVQGSLRYAWFCQNGKVCTAKALGELAAFVASVLPQVHACSATAAATIVTASSPSSYTCSDKSTCSGSSNDFAATKAAFEECYPSMGITCAMVGGLYDSTTNTYDTQPCSDASTSSSDDSTVAIAAGVGGGVAALLLLCVLFLVCKEKAGKPVFTNLAAGGAKA